jgi:tungstate transport system substrate-binding protein
MIFKKPFIILFLFSTFLFSSLAFSKSSGNEKLIRLATTTSTENSGLLTYLLPQFETESGYKVHVIAVGTGKALRMGRDGDVDIMLVHALKAEEKFVAEGFGDKRYPIMYNDFVIVGPKDESSLFSGLENAADVMDKIASSKKRFISRGDDSGTHKKELNLWKASKRMPDSSKDQWYVDAGQGMGKVLQMAGEMNAFTMTDRGTWLAYMGKSPLKILFEGDSKLFNPYGIIAVSQRKHPHVNAIGANALIKWMTSEKGQHLIGEFKVSDKVLFTPNATAMAKNETVTH